MCVCNVYLYIYILYTICPLYLISLFCSRRKVHPNAVLLHWCLVFDRRRCWKHKDVCLAQNIEGFHCPRSLRRFLLQRSCLFDDPNQTLGPSPSLMSRFSQMLWHLKPLTTLPKPRAYILSHENWCLEVYFFYFLHRQLAITFRRKLRLLQMGGLSFAINGKILRADSAPEHVKRQAGYCPTMKHTSDWRRNEPVTWLLPIVMSGEITHESIKHLFILFQGSLLWKRYKKRGRHLCM